MSIQLSLFRFSHFEAFYNWYNLHTIAVRKMNKHHWYHPASNNNDSTTVESTMNEFRLIVSWDF